MQDESQSRAPTHLIGHPFNYVTIDRSSVCQIHCDTLPEPRIFLELQGRKRTNQTDIWPRDRPVICSSHESAIYFELTAEKMPVECHIDGQLDGYNKGGPEAGRLTIKSAV